MSKLYYSSSEVSTMLELEPSVLRFWEDQFGQLRIKRNRAGKRMYREKDIELIRTIKQLTRDEGYTIAGAKKKLQEFAANRGAEKAVRTAERADRAAEQAAPSPVKADPGAAQADPGEQAAPGAESAAPGEHADPGERKTPPTDTSSQSELIQWLRSRLIEIRDSMD
ncbi:MAG: MerR family transcriptional regulator [Gemmatimonadetes bacterium]|nr:MerR family transcriptional regulator [Gemmatimonadota bacterium]MYD24259.1 MerR family transcriptional regulator [Gemmatimonadota bacterium]